MQLCTKMWRRNVTDPPTNTLAAPFPPFIYLCSIFPPNCSILSYQLSQLWKLSLTFFSPYESQLAIERLGRRWALQSARERQTNNMHRTLCIPNSDCRRLPAKEVLRIAEESYLLSLIMLERHSVETAMTPGRALCLLASMWVGGKKTSMQQNHRETERQEKPTLLSSVLKEVSVPPAFS